MTAKSATPASFARRFLPKDKRRRLVSMTVETPLAVKYFHDPVGYIRDVLGVTLTPDQETIARALPGRVKVNSGHGVGKSFLSACLVNWWFDTRDPGVVVSTAPRQQDVIDILWTEIRLQRRRAGLPMPFTGPAAAHMQTSEDHWAKGYTSRRGESFQGRHRDRMLFLFDESEGIDAVFWTVTNTMFKADQGHAWVVIGNPVTTASQSYLEDIALGEDGKPKWKLFTLSCLNHPNITAQLAGKPMPVPNAVSLDVVNQAFRDWTSPVDSPEDRQDEDLEWPPGSNKWYRPGPTFKARVLGVRPTEGVDTVWSMSAFDRMCQPRWDMHDCWRRNFGIQIGVDCALFGSDDTCFHVRSGPLSLHHESHNGWDPARSAGRLKELCREYAEFYNRHAQDPRPPLLATGVDVILEFDGGYGVGVHSHGPEFPRWAGITVGSASGYVGPTGKPLYANMRAEIWSEAAELAKRGMLDISRLPPEVRAKLRLQLTTPFYEPMANGSRKVESKQEIKKRLGRSPDDADALILSTYKQPNWAPSVVGVDR